MTRAERNDLIRELRLVDGLTAAEIALRVGLTASRVRTIAPMRPAGLRGAAALERNEMIRELRYMDGLTLAEVGRRVGLTPEAVRYLAPGRPGKIDNTLLREAFRRSRKPASAVARDLGWHSRPGGGVDASRVNQTLGITMTGGNSPNAQYRRMIDAEVAARIAESIGVEPWEVGCNDA